METSFKPIGKPVSEYLVNDSPFTIYMYSLKPIVIRRNSLASPEALQLFKNVTVVLHTYL